MCSVSFLPTDDGFHLAMNRDEQLSREAGLSPVIRRCGEFRAMYPHERSGGTWIGVNDAGLTLALINWYTEPQGGPGAGTRGSVIPALLSAGDATEVDSRLATVDVASVNPFRLILVSPREKRVREWRSSGGRLSMGTFPWRRRHWFSSGFDEPEANRVRRSAVLRAVRNGSPDSLKWLRGLHGSHDPEKGAYSICMHREDARTVSGTVVSVNAHKAVMRYIAGPPCERGVQFTRTLQILRETVG